MRLCVLLMLAGCSAAGMKDATVDEGNDLGGDGQSDTGEGVEDGDAGGQWWALGADLELVDGEVEAAGSSLIFELRSAGEVDCSERIAPTSVSMVTPLPHESVYTWWSVSWDPALLECFDGGTAPTAGTVLLGIGAMHPEVLALVGRLDEVQDAGAGETLNGAYATLDGDDRLLIYGVAGPSEAFAGSAGPAAAAPLADGTWMVRAIYSFGL